MNKLRKRSVPEKNIYYVWENYIFERKDLSVHGCGSVFIIDRGTRNFMDGPDYINAEIILDSELLRGDIEIHVNSSEWYLHRHHLSQRYDNVILHVVTNLDNDSIVKLNKDLIPQLDLSEYLHINPGIPMPVSNPSGRDKCRIEYLKHSELIKKRSFKLFLNRVDKIHNESKLFGEEQTLFRFLSEAMGYSRNTKIFSMLAFHSDINEIFTQIRFMARDDSFNFLLKYFSEILHHTKMSMNISEVRGYIRPSNSFIARLNALITLIVQFKDTGLQEGMLNIILKHKNLRAIIHHLKDLSRLNGVSNPGPGRWVEILGNVIIPFFYSVSGREMKRYLFHLYLQLPSGEKINKLNHFKLIQIPDADKFHVKLFLLDLYKNYCSRGRCDICEFR
ncbi:MAG: DUF2851 family protein [bacterium]|nr:DUF2851 family protein [bacterium]